MMRIDTMNVLYNKVRAPVHAPLSLLLLSLAVPSLSTKSNLYRRPTCHHRLEIANEDSQ